MITAVAALSGAGCRGPVAGPSGAAKGEGAKAALVYSVSPSRLLPELSGSRGFVALEGGRRRLLVDRMRLLQRDDGSIERASELLPSGRIEHLELPARLGGGFVFYANVGGGTEIWRAETWLGKLVPLVKRGETLTGIIPGFDRLYLRIASTGRLLAIHPQTGNAMSLAPLPPTSSYGVMVFADAWRAVVEVDLRGAMATFDAGRTWRPIGVEEKLRDAILVNGDPAVITSNGAAVVDSRGLVSRRPDVRGTAREEAPTEGSAPDPFGKRLLRAAVEDGWPDTETTAVVARGGALARVSLRDGGVLAMAEDAYPEKLSSCHAARLGLHGIGFLCGERDGATVVYEYAPPLAMKPVWRFEQPRFVSASGNGGLVVRGPCSDAPKEGEGAVYCVRTPAGQLREVQIKGDSGVERVVALGDGRVAVLVPPRGGDSGLLRILSGPRLSINTGGPLTIPEEPASAARTVRLGMWLDGVEERSPGVLGGWIEAGGPLVGVRITLDGKVELGEAKEDVSRAIFGGRFGVALFDGGRAEETSDGGFTWSSFEWPGREDARVVSTRACGPVGCALPGWTRVGWGSTENREDLKPAESPKAPYQPLKSSPTLSFGCDLTATSTPPLVEKTDPHDPRSSPFPSMAHAGITRPGKAPRLPRETPNGWHPFRNMAAPVLADGDVGLEGGSVYDTTPIWAYAWGKKATDWARTGRWQVRFDDRFDSKGGLRSSVPTASVWSDEITAAEGFGGNAPWTAYPDPVGRTALVTHCVGGGSACSFFAVADGEPILPIRDPGGAAGTLIRPFAGSAVRLGESWFFLSQSANMDAVTLHRVDGSVARPLDTYYRPTRFGYESPRLVRRALGGGLGILVSAAAEPGEPSGSWYVMPVDPDSGQLGEAVALGRRDLAGVTVVHCSAQQDGWLYEGTISSAPSLEIENASGSVENPELRLLLDPGSACIDAMASKSGPFYALGPKKAPVVFAGAPSSKPPLPPKAAPKPPTPLVKPGAKPLPPPKLPPKKPLPPPPKPVAPKPPPGPPAPKPLAAAPAHKSGAGDAALAYPLSVTERGSGRRWAMTCQLKKK